ncbi:hypothetical protein F1654_13450 [Alkalicaulis satelles]|uniref:Uncharacterized protein n=1 Tax=Alkalicaulis satelles TaxID=2609175 RepID=A0A5M6ZBA2_9PROT|nr:hypothetical protein [Alkalicaulis satelles]KAA5801057.1 hypothetical protein F1654_13450 [Alkalicaulis satelles]
MNDLNVEAVASALLEALTSQVFLLAYSWLGVVIALLLLLWFGFRLLSVIRDFNEAEMIRRSRGSPPRKPETIRNRILSLEEHARGGLQAAVRRSLGLVLYGIVAPGALLLIILVFDDWFIPGMPSLLDGEDLIDGSGVEAWRLAVFIADQALRGALTDTFEVFGLSVSNLSNNKDNILLSGLILAYRSLCGLVLISILVLLWRILSALPGLAAAINAYRSELRKLEEAGDRS